MSLLKEKDYQKWKRIISFAVLLFVCIVLLRSVYRVYNKKHKVDLALAESQQELYEMQNRENELLNLRDRINTKDGLEYELRKKFGVARVGESVVIIVDKDNTKDKNEVSQSFWQKIKSFFR